MAVMPMTFIVLILVSVIFIIGLILVASVRNQDNRSKRGDVTMTPCPSCGSDNPTHARFCARCGKALH